MTSSFATSFLRSSATAVAIAVGLLAIAINAHAKSVLGYPDLDGDGKSELVWDSRLSPLRSAVWLMDGTHYTDWAELERPTYFARLTSLWPDQDGDGKSDIVWAKFIQFPNELPPYPYYLSLMNGLHVVKTQPFVTDVITTPDLDGDGKSDVVLFDLLRQIVTTRLFDGVGQKGGAGEFAIGAWTPSGTGDFNGDGKHDLLFESTCEYDHTCFAIWLMDGISPKMSRVILEASRWRVVGRGDFDGDAKSDLIWRNRDTGEVAIWLMDGTVHREAAIIFGDPQWSPRHIGDFNGDGKSDILWRNEKTGTTAIWLMDGIAATSSAIMWTDPEWVVAQLGDFNGDGRSDLVWYRLSTYETAIWLMDGLTALEARIVLTDPDWFPRGSY